MMQVFISVFMRCKQLFSILLAENGTVKVRQKAHEPCKCCCCFSCSKGRHEKGLLTIACFLSFEVTEIPSVKLTVSEFLAHSYVGRSVPLMWPGVRKEDASSCILNCSALKVLVQRRRVERWRSRRHTCCFSVAPLKFAAQQTPISPARENVELNSKNKTSCF